MYVSSDAVWPTRLGTPRQRDDCVRETGGGRKRTTNTTSSPPACAETGGIDVSGLSVQGTQASDSPPPLM